MPAVVGSAWSSSLPMITLGLRLVQPSSPPSYLAHLSLLPLPSVQAQALTGGWIRALHLPSSQSCPLPPPLWPPPPPPQPWGLASGFLAGCTPPYPPLPPPGALLSVLFVCPLYPPLPPFRQPAWQSGSLRKAGVLFCFYPQGPERRLADRRHAPLFAE